MMNGSYEASRMSSYMRYFDFWTQARLDATAALGDKLDNLTRMASGEFLSGVSTVAGEIVIPEDADFKRTVNDRALYALDKLDSMDRVLSDFPKYLHDNTNFLQNWMPDWEPAPPAALGNNTPVAAPFSHLPTNSQWYKNCSW